MTYYAVIRDADDKVVGVGEDLPQLRPNIGISRLVITAQEFADVQSDGVYFPGTDTYQWEKQGTTIAKAADTRLKLTFTPDQVSARIGDTVQVQVQANRSLTMLLDMGVTMLQLTNGVGMLDVDTVVARKFEIGDGQNYTVASPLSVIVRPLNNRV